MSSIICYTITKTSEQLTVSSNDTIIINESSTITEEEIIYDMYQIPFKNTTYSPERLMEKMWNLINSGIYQDDTIVKMNLGGHIYNHTIKSIKNKLNNIS